LECVFISDGFEFSRQSGDHRLYVKEGVARPIVIPTYKQVDVEIIKSNMRTANMDRAKYFKLLQKCR